MFLGRNRRPYGPRCFSESIDIIQFGHDGSETGVERKGSNRFVENDAPAELRHN